MNATVLRQTRCGLGEVSGFGPRESFVGPGLLLQIWWVLLQVGAVGSTSRMMEQTS